MNNFRKKSTFSFFEQKKTTKSKGHFQSVQPNLHDK